MRTPDIVVDYLLAPLEFGFMQRGLLASVLVATICGILGSFVVLKRLAFIGDALAHASFSGVESYTTDLFGYLFGDVLSITESDLWTIAALGLVVLALVGAFYRQLLF